MSVFSDDRDDDQDNNIPNTQPNQYTARTYEEWQQMRKAAPSKYYSANMQRRMYADAAKLGKQAFFTKSKATKKWWE